MKIYDVCCVYCVGLVGCLCWVVLVYCVVD